MVRRATILITSVGSLVGRAVLDALAGRREALHLVGCNSIGDAPDLARCDDGHLVPRTDAADWGRTIRDLVRQVRPDAIIPGSDRDVRELCRLAAGTPGLADVLVAGSPELARAFDDKAATAAFAHRHGLPHVRTIATDDADAGHAIRTLLDEVGPPLIAKPADGSGSRGVRVLTDPDQVSEALRIPGMVLQPYLDPPPSDRLRPDLGSGSPLFWEVPEDRLYAVQTVIARDGTTLGAMSLRVRMVRGRPEELWVDRDPELAALGAAYAAAAVAEGWHGPLNVQAKRDEDGAFLAIEVNGRFSGGTSGRLLMGLDEVGLALNDLLGRTVVPARVDRPVDRVLRVLTDVATGSTPESLPTRRNG